MGGGFAVTALTLVVVYHPVMPMIVGVWLKGIHASDEVLFIVQKNQPSQRCSGKKRVVSVGIHGLFGVQDFVASSCSRGLANSKGGVCVVQEGESL